MSDRDFWRAVDGAVKGHRARKLAEADTEGWTQHTPWHYSREFNGERVEWWPSGGKARYRGRMIYGHAKVAELIDRLSTRRRDGFPATTTLERDNDSGKRREAGPCDHRA